MKLADLLIILHGPVKIGAKNGTGFWYCGYEPDLDRMDRFVRRLWKHMYDGSSERLQAMLSSPPSWNKYTIHYNDISQEGYEKYVKKWEHQCEVCRRLIEQYQRNMEHLIPMGDREVIEIRGAVNEESTIVLVEGEEKCKWWDTKEFEEDAHGNNEGEINIPGRGTGDRIKRSRTARKVHRQ